MTKRMRLGFNLTACDIDALYNACQYEGGEYDWGQRREASDRAMMSKSNLCVLMLRLNVVVGSLLDVSKTCSLFSSDELIQLNWGNAISDYYSKVGSSLRSIDLLVVPTLHQWYTVYIYGYGPSSVYMFATPFLISPTARPSTTRSLPP